MLKNSAGDIPAEFVTTKISLYAGYSLNNDVKGSRQRIGFQV